jgi:hypothetical protein
MEEKLILPVVIVVALIGFVSSGPMVSAETAMGVNPTIAAEISDEAIVSFVRSYVDTYHSYVDFFVKGEFKEYKDDKGHYVFFLYKNYPLHVRTVVSNETIGFEFIPANDFIIEILRNKNVSDLTKGAMAVEGDVRIKNSLVEDEYGAKFFAEIRVIPVDWLQNPKDLAIRDFNTDNHTVDIIRINKIWEPFKKENEEIIWNYRNLDLTAWEIDGNITFNEGYTYDLFFIDFNRFNLTVSHYRDLPAMVEQWNVFASSTENQRYFDFEKYPEIHSRAISIRDNITLNETYSLIHFQSDLQELNQTIRTTESKEFSYLIHHKENFYAGLIFLITTIYLLGLRRIERSLKQRQRDTTLKIFLTIPTSVISAAGFTYLYYESPRNIISIPFAIICFLFSVVLIYKYSRLIKGEA